mmetsp:Transcript_18864/g.33254  ORF Transcript_18864/g.33254 Transcript_18864/m.33254 type:complete len:136 (+) Transcript_18864:522-929(+)
MTGRMVQSKTHKKLAKFETLRIRPNQLVILTESWEGKLACSGVAPLIAFFLGEVEGMVSEAASEEENRIGNWLVLLRLAKVDSRGRVVDKEGVTKELADGRKTRQAIVLANRNKLKTDVLEPREEEDNAIVVTWF